MLTAEERRLIAKHGYPLRELERALGLVQDNPDVVALEMSRSEFEHLLGELARSINHSRDLALQERLNDLYEKLEWEGSRRKAEF